MNNKFLKSTLLLSCLAILTGCGDNQPSLSTSTGHVHSYLDTVVESRCEIEGYTLHQCVDCEYNYRDNFTPALEHDYSIFVNEVADLENNAGEIIEECSLCFKQRSSLISDINTVDKGVKTLSVMPYDRFLLNDFNYSDTSFSMKISNISNHFECMLYYSFKADEGLFYNQAYRVDFDYTGKANTYVYETSDYTILNNNLNIVSLGDSIYLNFPYNNHGVTKEQALGNFAFYLIVKEGFGAALYEYRLINPYVLPHHSETWIKVNKNNRCYYNTKYQNHKVDNWERPDITKADINWTHICREETPEAAIVSTLIAEEKGATNVDVNLLSLRSCYRDYDSFYKIFHSFKNIGTIGVYYNGNVSQQERLNTLKLAIEAGAGGIDMQGFMYHEGSTLDTQTETNIKYWEDLGFDMSFVDAKPKETSIDPTEVAKQIEYIDMIHDLGGKVLGSHHVSTAFSRTQIMSYAKFLDHKGFDIIKVVSTANNKMQHDDTVYANTDVYYSDEVKAKFSIHCTGDSRTNLSRIIGPLFYHTYMAFHYTDLCHLKLCMDILNSGIALDDNITIEEAISRSIGKTNDPEFTYLVSEYRKLNDLWAFGYGASSDLSDKWSNVGDDISLNLRNATGTNSFSFRGVAYRDSFKSNNFTLETSITGNFKPYTSTTRLPKFGVFIGDTKHLIGITYDYKTSSGIGTSFAISIRYNSYDFEYDTQTKDALDTTLMTPITLNNNVTNGGVIKIKIVYNNGELSIYYNESNNSDYTLVRTFGYDEIKDLFTHNKETKEVYFGNIAEAYLGTSSVGVSNDCYFDNIITKH